MTPSLTTYDDLLHRVYDSAMQPTTWPETLRAVAEVFDVRRVALWTLMHGVESGGICFTHNLEQSVLEAWAQVSPTEDPFVQAVLRRNLLVDGAAYEGFDIVPRARIVESRLYRDIWVPLDIGHLCSGVVFAGTDGRQLPTALSLYRSESDRPFELAEVDLLRRLLLHFSRSLGVMFHLQDRAHQIAASRAALNRLAAGVVLLDASGGVQFANLVADRMLEAGDLVQRVPLHTQRNRTRQRGSTSLDRLVSASASLSVQAAFAKALAAALEPYGDVQDIEHFAEALIVPDRDGKPVLVMSAAPLGHAPNFGAGNDSVRAIVFFHPLRGASSIKPARLCQIFGLTPAEARAAMQLLEGGSAEDMAARLGVTVNTFKTQIKVVYTKTNTNRQVGLLRLMLSLDGI